MQYLTSKSSWLLSMLLSVLLVLLLLLQQISVVEAKSNIEEMKCAVCRVLVGEINNKISLADPKKKVQVGSFRVDPDGNQKTHEVPYGRSELHLVEIMENLCESMKHYAETTNKLGKKSLIRTITYAGVAVSLDNFNVAPELSEKIKYMCDNILEDYEEKMIELFRRLDIKDHGARLCRDVMRVCTSADMEIEMPKAPLKSDVEAAAEARRKAASEESEEDDDSEESDDEDDNDSEDKQEKKNDEL